MTGIKETTDVVDFVIQIVNAVIKSKADGKVDSSDVGYLMAALMKAGPAFAGMSAIPAELKDLSEAELAALIASVEAGVTIGDESQEIIACALAVSHQLFKLYGLLNKAPVVTLVP